LKTCCVPPGCDQLCAVQVWSPGPAGVADDVRPGQDVPALPQPLEAGDANQSAAARRRRRHCHIQGQLHQVDHAVDLHISHYWYILLSIFAG